MKQLLIFLSIVISSPLVNAQCSFVQMAVDASGEDFIQITSNASFLISPRADNEYNWRLTDMEDNLIDQGNSALQILSLGSPRPDMVKMCLKVTNSKSGLVCEVCDILQWTGPITEWLLLTNNTGILPVELTDFKAALKKDVVHFSWQTASEFKNKGFEIEQSTNARDWQKIDFVKGQGISFEINQYQIQDLNPSSGLNYYRLKQIDFDGAVVNLEVILVDYTISENNIRIFPNPSNQFIDIQIDNPSFKKTKIKITDNLGRKIWESDLVEVETFWKKNMEFKSSGIYFIMIQMGDQIFNERVIIRQ